MDHPNPDWTIFQFATFLSNMTQARRTEARRQLDLYVRSIRKLRYAEKSFQGCYYCSAPDHRLETCPSKS